VGERSTSLLIEAQPKEGGGLFVLFQFSGQRRLFEEEGDHGAKFVGGDEPAVCVYVVDLVGQALIEAQKGGSFCFQAFLFFDQPDGILRDLAGLFFSLRGREVGVAGEFEQTLDNRLLAEDLLTIADCIAKDSEAFEAPEEDALFNSAGGNEIENEHLLTALTKTINAPDALFEAHGIPRDVVIDHTFAKLIIKALATNLRRKQDIHCVMIGSRLPKPGAQVFSLFVLSLTGHHGDAITGRSQFALQIVESVEKIGKDEQLAWKGTIANCFGNAEQRFEFGILGRKLCGELAEMLGLGANLGRQLEFVLVVVGVSNAARGEAAGFEEGVEGRQKGRQAT